MEGEEGAVGEEDRMEQERNSQGRKEGQELVAHQRRA